MTRRRILVHEAIEMDVSDMNRHGFVVVVRDLEDKLHNLEYERQSISDLHKTVEHDAERNHWTILTVRAV